MTTANPPTSRMKKLPRRERRNESTSPLLTDNRPLEAAMNEMAHDSSGVSRQNVNSVEAAWYRSKAPTFL